jgi:general transcription factor 3C polypeptide 3 (transcription factor C subunit 4)
MMRFYQDLRHNKFCLRLFVKHPDNLSLAYINGHNALISGSYKHALGKTFGKHFKGQLSTFCSILMLVITLFAAEYMSIHKQNPEDPFAALCLALGFTHLVCQKFITNRHSVVVQVTVAFHKNTFSP